VLKINDKKLYRLVDANFNRAKEGLRVCEDICRFVLNQKGLTRSIKLARHRLTKIVIALGIRKLISARNIEGDVGKKTLAGELKRKKTADILYANTQRVKESIRVLEEFAKLKNSQRAEDLKRLRYKIYALEKKIVEGG